MLQSVSMRVSMVARAMVDTTILSIALLLIASCTDPVETTEGCEAGMTQACTCPDGERSTQVCASDNVFGVCACNDGPSDMGAVDVAFDGPSGDTNAVLDSSIADETGATDTGGIGDDTGTSEDTGMADDTATVNDTGGVGDDASGNDTGVATDLADEPDPCGDLLCTNGNVCDTMVCSCPWSEQDTNEDTISDACLEGFDCCTDGCFDLLNDDEHCGACTGLAAVCDDPADHDTHGCNGSGGCDWEACDATWYDCEMPWEVCDSQLDDISHCGECGRDCAAIVGTDTDVSCMDNTCYWSCQSTPISLENMASATCDGGVLEIVCKAGFSTCDDPWDGCVPDDVPCGGIIPSNATGVFVSSTNGRNNADGTMADPHRDLADGVSQAESESKTVFVAGGSYSGGFSTSVSILGGYNPGDWIYDLPNQVVSIRGANAEGRGVTVEPGMGNSVVIDGLDIMAMPASGNARGLWIEDGTVLVSHCTIDGGPGTPASTAVLMSTASTVYAVNNVIRGGTGTTASLGVHIYGTAILLNNTIFGGPGPDVSTAIDIAGGGHATLVNNVIQTGEGTNYSTGVRLYWGFTSSILMRNNSIYGADLTCHFDANFDSSCLDLGGLNDCGFTGCVEGTAGNIDYDCDAGADGSLPAMSVCEEQGVDPTSFYDVASISGFPMSDFLSLDIDLQERPRSMNWDLGADEL